MLFNSNLYIQFLECAGAPAPRTFHDNLHWNEWKKVLRGDEDEGLQRGGADLFLSLRQVWFCHLFILSICLSGHLRPSVLLLFVPEWVAHKHADTWTNKQGYKWKGWIPNYCGICIRWQGSHFEIERTSNVRNKKSNKWEFGNKSFANCNWN